MSPSLKLICLLWLAAVPGLAQEIICLQQGWLGYAGCQDAHILINKPDWNTGEEDGLEVTGNGGEADAKHGLVRFDLSSLTAVGSVDSAWLSLYLVKRRAPQSGNKELAVYRLNQPWQEGAGNDMVGYDGRPAVPGEVTWQFASTPDQAWGIPGANHIPLDHVALPEDQKTISSADPNGQWHAWKITDMVRFWITHPDSNFGLLLREPIVSNQTGILNFASSQYEPDTLRPRLYIYSGQALPYAVAGTMQATSTQDAITLVWPYRGDANANNTVEVSLARAGEAQWGPRFAMIKMNGYYSYTFTGLRHGAYHVRAWMSDPDGVQGQATQTLLNIEVTPNYCKGGQLYTTILNDNRIQAVLTFSFDSDGDNSAQLEHKSSASADWLNDGNMTRSPGKFEMVLAGLSNGQTYDLRVTLQDPDGIDGDSVFVARITLPHSTSLVRVLAFGRKQFHLQSGNYSVLYDSTQTEGYLWIYSSQMQKILVRNALVKGLPFQILDPALIDTILLNDEQDRIEIVLYGHWQDISYQVNVDCEKQSPGLFHWRCSLQNASTLAVPNGTFECTFYDRERRFEIGAMVETYVEQAPYCTGLAFGYDSQAVQGTLLYLQNFTRLNDYFALQQTAPERCVSLSNSGFGFTRPANNRALRKEPTIICDAFLYVTPGKPSSENALAEGFCSALAKIYVRLDKPAIEQVDWSGIAAKLIADLSDERCLATVAGEKLFRSYVAVPRPARAEAITQLDVLLGLRQYEKAGGAESAMDDLLSQNLYQFYNLEHRTMVNDAPNEGVQEGDSWYAVHIHLGLSRLAKMGDTNARTLLFLSLPKLMAFARQMDYEFPVFFRYGDNTAISGKEPDAAGGYVYLMLDAYDLSKDAKYLDEAKTAANHLSGHGFAYTYEVHMTAATCAAMARLYRITHDKSYLEKSYLPFANLLALAWLWECDYGYAAYYPTFFGLAPMAGASVITMMEQHHSWSYLREFRDLARADLPEAMNLLLDGFIAYTPMVLKYSLPSFLPAAAVFIGPTVYDSYNVSSFHIPLEDLRDGWQKSGSLGQQIYGAGGPFVFAAGSISGIDENQEEEGRVSTYGLVCNYPNPFNSSTIIQYIVPGDLQHKVQLDVYDVLGRLVRNLVAETHAAGVQEVRWDGHDQTGNSVSAGVYFVLLQTDENKSVRKILLLR